MGTKTLKLNILDTNFSDEHLFPHSVHKSCSSYTLLTCDWPLNSWNNYLLTILFFLQQLGVCGPGVNLIFCCFVVYSTRLFVLSYLVLFCSCVFQFFLHCDYLTLGRERANLSAFCTFVRFALVWFCLFPLSLGVWEGLRFVIVALPGLFSYLFLYIRRSSVLRHNTGTDHNTLHYKFCFVLATSASADPTDDFIILRPLVDCLFAAERPSWIFFIWPRLICMPLFADGRNMPLPQLYPDHLSLVLNSADNVSSLHVTFSYALM